MAISGYCPIARYVSGGYTLLYAATKYVTTEYVTTKYVTTEYSTTHDGNQTMQLANRKWQVLTTVLLTGVLLRAFIPAGYMPAAPGQGLLFELCPSGLPAGFTSAAGDHDGHSGHHSSHNAHDENPSDGDCSLGHILSFAFIDAVDVPDLDFALPTGIIAAVSFELVTPARQYAYAPRGPPLP